VEAFSATHGISEASCDGLTRSAALEQDQGPVTPKSGGIQSGRWQSQRILLCPPEPPPASSSLQVFSLERGWAAAAAGAAGRRAIEDSSSMYVRRKGGMENAHHRQLVLGPV
jgi:hypothetical protein